MHKCAQSTNNSHHNGHRMAVTLEPLVELD
jgi:hypothetical protein